MALDFDSSQSLGYSYTKDGKKPSVQNAFSSDTYWDDYALNQGYVGTSEQGVMYNVDTGEYRRFGATPEPAKAVEDRPTRPRPTAPSSGGGGYTAPKPLPAPPKVEPPKPIVTNTKVGSAIGGGGETLGAKMKSVFDEGAKGLKGLTIGGGPKDVAEGVDEKERTRFGQGLFNVGLVAPKAGTGVQV